MNKYRDHTVRPLLCALLISLVLVPISIIFAQVHPVRSQDIERRPINLDFEEGEPGKIPNGWVYPVPKGYSVELSEENPKSGKRSALLKSSPGTTIGNTGFGNIMQAFDAEPFRGKRVRFRGAVRLDGADPTARARLWMRVVRRDGKNGFFDNMVNRPVTSKEWGYYEITGDVDADATVINIGMILLGSGKAWLDDTSFKDLGKLVIRTEPPRPLTKKGMSNVFAFTRLLGYVRHFHPSDEAVATDWNKFAVDGMRAVESATTPRALAKKLELLFGPIAPTVRVFPTGVRTRLPDALKLPKAHTSLRVVSWRHVGFGNDKVPEAIYKSQQIGVEAREIKRSSGSPNPQKPFSAELGGGVSCLVPLALFADAYGTLPHSAPRLTEAATTIEKYSGDDRATRLADIALAWNVLRHFYSYFDVVQTDWRAALTDALTTAATDRDERAFLTTLRRMIARLDDGHGAVYHSSEANFYTVPAIFGWVEGRLVVTDVAEHGAEGLKPGETIVTVDGEPSLKKLLDLESLISGATPQWRRYRSLNALRSGPKDSELKLLVIGLNGQMRNVVLRRNMKENAIQESRPPKVSEVKPGIFYLDLDRIKDEDFLAALSQLQKAKGIIFDLRGYPKVSEMLIAHLIDKPVQSARWNIPVITAPDYSNVTEYVTEGRWLIDPAPPRLKARLAFITDGRAISYAESYMGIIEAYKLAEIVGEPTAGTNGNINWMVLPGEYRVIWTGMKALKHDGSRYHGIGIHPTVAVSRTVTGVKEKRDEQLERAINLVSESPGPATNAAVPKLTPKPLSDEVMNMELTALDGSRFKLADYEGKVVIVNLWASWCGPCRSEMPDLIKLSKEFENRDVVVIGLTSEDPVKDRILVKDFVRYFKIRYKIGWGDARFVLGLMQGQVRNSIPQTFVISRDGSVTKRFIGFNPVETPPKLHKAVEEALKFSNE